MQHKENRIQRRIKINSQWEYISLGGKTCNITPAQSVPPIPLLASVRKNQVQPWPKAEQDFWIPQEEPSVAEKPLNSIKESPSLI